MCVILKYNLVKEDKRERSRERELNRMCVVHEMVTAAMKLKDTFSLEGKL